MGFIDMVIIFVIIITIIANQLLRTQPFRLSKVPQKREPVAPIHFQSYSSTIQRLRRGMSAQLGRPILVEFYKRQLIVDRQMSKVVLFPRWAQLPAWSFNIQYFKDSIINISKNQYSMIFQYSKLQIFIKDLQSSVYDKFKVHALISNPVSLYFLIELTWF